jgi:hypothetical protein
LKRGCDGYSPTWEAGISSIDDYRACVANVYAKRPTGIVGCVGIDNPPSHARPAPRDRPDVQLAAENWRLSDSTMKCPDCLSKARLLPAPGLIPVFLFPLHLVVACVQCDSCLHSFYRVRLFGWKIRSRRPAFDDPHA